MGQDPTNLQTKLQKHQNFEAEVEANRTRIESIRAAGNELIENDHYAKETIRLVVDLNCKLTKYFTLAWRLFHLVK